MSTTERCRRRTTPQVESLLSKREDPGRQSAKTHASFQPSPGEGDPDFPRASRGPRPMAEEDTTSQDQLLPVESDSRGPEASHDPSEPLLGEAGRDSPRPSTSSGATGAGDQESWTTRGCVSGAGGDATETVEIFEVEWHYDSPSIRTVSLQVDEDALDPVPIPVRGPFTWLKLFDKPDCNRFLAIMGEQLVPSFPFILGGLILLQIVSLGLPWWFTKVKGHHHVTYGLFMYWNGSQYQFYTEYPKPILMAAILESLAAAWTLLLPIQLCCKPCSSRANFFCVWLMIWALLTSFGVYLAFMGFLGDKDVRVDTCVILVAVASLIGLYSALFNCCCMYKSRMRMDIEAREAICEAYNAPFPGDEPHKPRERYRSYHHPESSHYACLHNLDNRPYTLAPRYPRYGSTDSTARGDDATPSTSRAGDDGITSQPMTMTSSTASTSQATDDGITSQPMTSTLQTTMTSSDASTSQAAVDGITSEPMTSARQPMASSSTASTSQAAVDILASQPMTSTSQTTTSSAASTSQAAVDRNMSQFEEQPGSS